jgi:hypothetical protein
MIFHWCRTGAALDCSISAIAETKGCQSSIPQSIDISLAALGRINDAFGNHFVDDLRLAPVVEGSAGGFERLVHGLGGMVVKGDSGFTDKR